MTEERILYYYSLCPFARKVRIILEEKKLPYKIRTVLPWNQPADFFKINPFGDLPVLMEPDGHVLMQSAAIAEYLNEIKTSSDLMGETPRGRAEVRRLQALFDGSFYFDVYKPVVGERVVKVLKEQGEPNSSFIRVGRKNLTVYLDYLDWLAARRSCMASRVFSIADATVWAHLSIFDYLGEIEWDNWPDLQQWYSKIKSRPSIAPLLHEVVAGIAPAKGYANVDF